MDKRTELYVIQEPEAPAAPDVVPVGVTGPHGPADASPDERPLPRERLWRNLMRRLEKNLLPRRPGSKDR